MGGLAELRPTLPEIPDTLCFCDFPSIDECAESVLRTNFNLVGPDQGRRRVPARLAGPARSRALDPAGPEGEGIGGALEAREEKWAPRGPTQGRYHPPGNENSRIHLNS